MGKERDLDAAERALGTLPRKGETPKGRREREAWEQRLATLLRPVEPVAPPPGLFARISEHLGHHETRRELARSRRTTRRWQGIAALAGLTVAGLAALLLLPTLAPDEPRARLIAVVASDETGEAAMVVTLDADANAATIVPTGARAPDGRAFEMWYLPADGSPPVSLGLLPAGPVAAQALDATPAPGDAFAISVEAPGGSATGLPTDARYSGRVEAME